MAKEMMIIFVYDTKLLQKEEDDPATAILYFYPGWVSDQQRTSLCGQIIGTWHFLNSVFKCPRIFALQSGKFSIRTYGRYLLAVGTDRNIADWLLEHRADTLTSLIRLFHCDLGKMAQLYKENDILSAKLYHMFETYLKILMYGGHMFFNVPTMQLPKSVSQVFLEAVQLLECCQQLNNVLGGTILYHNKVVTTQLSSDLTKLLVLTDPYRIKSPAEIFAVNYSLPLSVQLLQVYIEYEEYTLLNEEANKFRTMPNYFSKKIKKNAREQPILSTIKREQSIIFTTVPEEETDQNLNEKIANAKSPDRPKFLNLKNKTTDSKFEVKNEKPSLSTPFYGQTSVCSTPMTELNKVLHQNILSICVNSEEKPVQENIENSNKIAKIEKRAIFENGSQVQSSVAHIPKSTSLLDFREKLKSYKNNFIKRYNELSISNTDLPALPKKIAYQTISDPLYPFFKSNGLVISNSLHDQYLNEPLDLYEFEIESSYSKDSNFKSNQQSFTRSVQLPQELELKTIKPSAKSKERRKSLTLPLKSLSSEQTNDITTPSRTGTTSGLLTPLMSKLSSLTLDEKSSGFCSKDTTPGDYKDFNPSSFAFLKNARSEKVEANGTKTPKLQEAVLFVCGQQDMVMCLLLDNNIASTPEVVSQLWEMCSESLGKLERHLRHCLETYSGGNSQSETSEPYSYLCLDPQWDTIQRGGPWSSTELGALTHLHRDFINSSNLTEILLRNDETVLYGHHCGETEVFYQQAASSAAGLPTPVDAMANVALKAKRRLERDHAIVLL